MSSFWLNLPKQANAYLTLRLKSERWKWHWGQPDLGLRSGWWWHSWQRCGRGSLDSQKQAAAMLLIAMATVHTPGLSQGILYYTLVCFYFHSHWSEACKFPYKLSYFSKSYNNISISNLLIASKKRGKNLQV